VVDNLPATVPVAAALVLVEVRLRGSRTRSKALRASEYYARSRQADEIPPPAT